MLYWLFTDFKDTAVLLIFPLMCLAIPMPIITTVMLGAGIQRQQDDTTSNHGWLKVFTIVIVLATVIVIYVMFTAEMAIQPIRGRQTTNSFIHLLSGAPDTVNHMRLFMFGMMLLFVWFVVALGLPHSTTRKSSA